MTNKFDPCKPWIFKYIKHELKPETGDDDLDSLCYVGQIRKIHCKSNTNELIIADGLHEIKCDLNGFIGDDAKTEYIENKMIDLKQFDVKIDGITNNVYFLVLNCEIYKLIPILPAIFGSFCKNINTDHRIQILLQQQDENGDVIIQKTDIITSDHDQSTSSKTTETEQTINTFITRKRCLDDIDDNDIEPPSKRLRVNDSDNSFNSLPPEIDHEQILQQINQINPISNNQIPPIITSLTNILDTGYNVIDYGSITSMPINGSIPSYIDHSHHIPAIPSIPPILETPISQQSVSYHDVTSNPLQNHNENNETYIRFQCTQSTNPKNDNHLNHIYVSQQFDPIPNISNDLSNLSQVIKILNEQYFDLKVLDE